MGVINRIYSSFRPPVERYFRTKNLHLAAILLAQGFRLAVVDTDDPANCEFVFRNTRELEQMVERFNRKMPIFVDARRLIHFWKFLREKINTQANNKHARGF